MKTNFKIKDRIDALLMRMAASIMRFKIVATYEWECYDKFGNLKWRDCNHNICTDEGLNRLLDVMFHGTTQIATWYIGLFESDTTPAAGTTYATPVFTESTAYDEATRPAFNEAAASSKVTTNSANKAVFTMNDTKTIYGAFLCGGGTDPNTKGDTAGGGVIFNAAQFASGSKSVVDDDVLNVTVTLTAADA
jgi:hypothetical protein